MAASDASRPAASPRRLVRSTVVGVVLLLLGAVAVWLSLRAVAEGPPAATPVVVVAAGVLLLAASVVVGFVALVGWRRTLWATRPQSRLLDVAAWLLPLLLAPALPALGALLGSGAVEATLGVAGAGLDSITVSLGFLAALLAVVAAGTGVALHVERVRRRRASSRA